MTTITVFLGLLLLVIALTPRFSPRLYSKLIFHPIAAQPYNTTSVAGVRVEDVYLKAPSKPTLHGWFFDVPGAKSVVLVSHGNAGNVEEWQHLASRLIRMGCSVFVWDYRGYGLSEGRPDVAGTLEDGQRAYDYLTKVRGIPAQKILLMGISLGGGPTCAVAERHPCQGIVLHGAFASLTRVGRSFVPVTKYLPDALFFKPGMYNAVRLRRIGHPLLILHGEHDEIIDPANAHENFAAAAGEKELVILRNSSHMDVATDGERYMSALTAFIARVQSRA